MATHSKVKLNIYAFEPNPPMIERIKQKFFHHSNAHLFSKCNLYLFPYALGDSECKLDLICPEGSFGEAHIASSDHQNSPEEGQQNRKIKTVEVEVKVLNDLLKEQGVDQIDALKIDIEGYEDKVLKPFFESAPSSLLPRAILIEHASRELWSNDCINEAEKLGYKIEFTTRLNTALSREQH